MPRPLKTVHMTTTEELDPALATADQITVEGDNELLSCAVNRAVGSESCVNVELNTSQTYLKFAD
jgi:hypothetical protein